MPWCETCSRFWTPTSMQPGGACPTCGAVIAEVKAHPRAPWHFVLLVVGVVIYLGYRAVQGVVWLAHHG